MIQARYVKALEDLRFPYLNLSTLAHGIPLFFFDETVRVAADTEKDNSKRYSEFQIRNPTQRPYVPKVGAPYTPEGFATNRHLSENYLSKADETSCLNMIKIAQHLFTLIFIKSSLLKTKVVHDALHSAVGDVNVGHMEYPDVAAFGPIFFYIIAMLIVFVAIGNHRKKIGVDTDLIPFKKSDTEFLNSNDVSLTHWQDRIRVKKNYLGYPFTIRVFFDDPNANSSTTTSSQNYVG
ncbi:9200_t:CDS:2, partial [Rhizophagus irregularis]